MAYERTLENKTHIATILKSDDNNEDMRILINTIYEKMGYSNSNIATKTLAQIVTDVGTLLGR